MLLPQPYQYPNLSEGADRVGGQLRGDKECLFSGVTKSGRVWRKVPNRDARSVTQILMAAAYIDCTYSHGEERTCNCVAWTLLTIPAAVSTARVGRSE